MKKVLIINYYWPPSGGGGVQRWLKFVKYLRQFGWEPVVFTPENPESPVDDQSLLQEIPEGIKVIKTKIWEPYSFYKLLSGRKSEKIQTAFLKEKKSSGGLIENLSVWIRGNLFIPDARKFWINPSVGYLKKYLKNEKVDAIVSTGPPHSTHLIALQVKKELGLPWLADFRDPWTNIDYFHELKLGRRADKKHRLLEKSVLETADAVTVVSPGMIKEFSAIVDRTYYFIPNGYDSEDFDQVSNEVHLSSKFSITHIGSLTRSRNPDKLWQVLSELVKSDLGFANDLLIHNVGKMDFSVKESINENGLRSYLKITDYMPHSQVINEQRDASLLLLLINNTPNANLILTGKIFEYLASRRPIICIAPENGNAANIIAECRAGKVFGFDENEKLKTEIIHSYHQFRQNKLHAVSKGIDKYDRRNLTGQMAQLLSSLTV